MKVRFWGVRGSIASPGADTAYFGGNTSCYEVICRNGLRFILDAGTGLRNLGLAMLPEGPSTVHLLISHTHWDHIQGFPFFSPAFFAGNVIHLYGPIQPNRDLAAVIRMQMDYEVFPVREAELKSTLIYHNLGEGVFELDGVRVYTRFTNHPVMTLSYRIEEAGRSVVYTGDTEPYYNVFHVPGKPGVFRLSSEEEAALDAEVRGLNEAHIDFCRGTDLLIHDAQYTAEEYHLQRRGWGHSPMEHAYHVAMQAGVKRLALSHHDPTRCDKDLRAIEQHFSQRAAQAGGHTQVFCAYEGLELEL